MLFQYTSGTVKNRVPYIFNLLVAIAVPFTVLRYILAFLPRIPVFISMHTKANPELSFVVTVGDVNLTVTSS